MPRKAFDGNKLAEDIAQMQAADKMSPPSARPSLMDAVRALATYIETRTTLGWTDAMIAAVLTEAGYAIDAATLCSYRKRMRDAGLAPPKVVRSPVAPIPQVMPTATIKVAAVATDKAVAPAGVSLTDTTGSSVEVVPPGIGPPPRAAPGAPTRPRRSFTIDPSNLKPDRA